MTTHDPHPTATANDFAGVDTAAHDRPPAGSSPWPRPGEPMAWPRLVVAAAAMAATVAALTIVAYTAAAGHPVTAAHATEITAAAWLLLAGLGVTQVVAARASESVAGAELALCAVLLAAVFYAAATDRSALAVAAAIPYVAFDVITVVRPRRLLTHARAAVVCHLSRCEDCGHAVPDTVPAGLFRRVTALDRRGWRLELADGLICPTCTCDRYGHHTIPTRPDRPVRWLGPAPALCRRCGTAMAAVSDEAKPHHPREQLHPGAGRELHRTFGARRPPITVLCGSTRFTDAFDDTNRRLTMAGHIVLSIGVDTKSGDQPWSARTKARLDALHKRKIDLADWVLVLNVDGYLGDSTRSEIAYARAAGKPVSYRYPEHDTDQPGEADQ